MEKLTPKLACIIPLLLAALLGYGQSVKRTITVADYPKWSALRGEKISQDGLWVSYELRYDYAADTLFVQHCKSGKKLVFPLASDPVFSSDGKWLTVLDPKKGMIIQELKSGATRIYKGIIRHEFFTAKKYLALLRKNGDAQELLIEDFGNHKKYTIPQVSDFSISPDGKIAVNTLHEIRIIDPDKNFTEKTIAQDMAQAFKKMQWSENGNSLAFLQELPQDTLTPRNHKIYFYDIAASKIHSLDPISAKELQSQRIMIRFGMPALIFSPDGKRIFFALTTPRKLAVEEPLQVWDSETPLEYTQNKYQGDTQYIPKLAVWSPQKNSILKIGTQERPKVILTKDKNHAICYNALKYEPQFEYKAPADMYLKNTHSGHQRMILEKQLTAIGMIGSSSKGNFIHYFKDGHWWIYDIANDKHCNVTSGLNLSLINKQDNYPGPLVAFDSPGWSDDEKYFIIYDQYDIWFLSSDGKIVKKITDGSKTKTQYRICTHLYDEPKARSQDEFPVRKLDFTRGLIIEALGADMSSGYYKWSADGGIKKIVYKESGISRLQKAVHADAYIFVEQTVSIPPRLMLINGTSVPPKCVFQSNAQSAKFNWAQAELLSYSNKNGDNLKGILYKPAGYNPKKKYPMVVFIYEILSYGLHRYYPPTEYLSTGFTPSNYFLDDYLVLFPDITYRYGEPGISAADCVESAIAAVKQKGIVEENHIGIIGHSYGGYQASYIITQSSTFAAAVSGSGVMDLTANYFTYTSDEERSNAWRYESQQGRMSFSPFSDWQAYARNSVLENADKITTPLLTWAGQQDKNVFWTQSAQLHLALRRLKKKNLFLVYPAEGHMITNSALQKDLTTKTKNWFDLYLKNKTIAYKGGIP